MKYKEKDAVVIRKDLKDDTKYGSFYANEDYGWFKPGKVVIIEAVREVWCLNNYYTSNNSDFLTDEMIDHEATLLVNRAKGVILEGALQEDIEMNNLPMEIFNVEDLQVLSSLDNPLSVLGNAFYWYGSKEGYEYWENIQGELPSILLTNEVKEHFNNKPLIKDVVDGYVYKKEDLNMESLELFRDLIGKLGVKAKFKFNDDYCILNYDGEMGERYENGELIVCGEKETTFNIGLFNQFKPSNQTFTKEQLLKHGSLILEWLKGDVEIESYNEHLDMAILSENPSWDVNIEYRIKPKPLYVNSLGEEFYDGDDYFYYNANSCRVEAIEGSEINGFRDGDGYLEATKTVEGSLKLALEFESKKK